MQARAEYWTELHYFVLLVPAFTEREVVYRASLLVALLVYRRNGTLCSVVGVELRQGSPALWIFLGFRGGLLRMLGVAYESA